MSNHSLFSPSQLTLRSYCPASYKLELENQEYIEKEYEPGLDAKRGTELHDRLRDIFTQYSTLEKLLVYCIDGCQEQEEVKKCVEEVVKVLINKKDDNDNTLKLYAERQVDLEYLGIEKKDGCKVDLLAVLQDKIIIFDYKFTKEKKNYDLQLRSYALALYREFKLPVEYYIIFPSLDTVVSNELTTEEQAKQQEEMIKTIITNCNAENPVLIRGAHCKDYFCKCLYFCQAWNDQLIGLSKFNIEKAHNYICTLSPFQLSNILDNIEHTQKKIELLEKIIKSYVIEKDIQLENYRVCKGKTFLKWNDKKETITLFKKIAEKHDVKFESLIEPVSVSVFEKLTGLKQEDIKDYITVEYGKKYLRKV